jgi:hypothetical protein
MKRLHYLFLIALGCAPSGCSLLIMDCGKKIEDCKTRDEVRALIGEPEITGVNESDEFDDFFTHAKIAESNQANILGIYVATTLGIYEIIWTPYQGYRALKNIICGQRIRVYYDTDGRVCRFESNDLKLHHRRFLGASSDGPEDETSRHLSLKKNNADDALTGPDFYPTWLHAKESIVEPESATTRSKDSD